MYCLEAIKILQNWGVDFDRFGIVRIKVHFVKLLGLFACLVYIVKVPSLTKKENKYLLLNYPDV